MVALDYDASNTNDDNNPSTKILAKTIPKNNDINKLIKVVSPTNEKQTKYKLLNNINKKIIISSQQNRPN